ncbi:unnamed protein product [Rotaria socialis]|uniref:Tektin n=1 Tax=Rotaria socialis TaxID=392032 RepID=A0A820W5U7_9BILA|nr:unnamed protein product [Rotaria socialis]CAF3459479.1 unnamed protein product [Rotaria socialis]CAF3467092.1 unnamed protein product [Rotaria socialis]CAF3750153.1 unnamed protein product [Rotaria socialis]CAF4511288.1 unnamed protein product [Rotaria socialis]
MSGFESLSKPLKSQSEVTVHTFHPTLEQKPRAKYNVPDWFNHNYAISYDAERSRNVSHQVRQDGRRLINETYNESWWNKHDNDVRISNRLDEVDKWRKALEYTIQDVDREVQTMQSVKEQCERYLEHMRSPLDITLENHVTRDGRKAIDNVDDEAERELKKEVYVIDGIKRQLHQQVQTAFDQIARLTEAKQQLIRDLQDKHTAFAICEENLQLNEFSPNIGYKPDACRPIKGQITPEEWVAFSKYNKDRAEKEIYESTRLRESIFHTIGQSSSDLESQGKASEYALRKRLHELERSLRELEWQKKQTEEEILSNENDIDRLEKAVRDKEPLIKLAMSRQENRHSRPGMDLVRDEVTYGLCDEIQQLTAEKRALEDRLKQTKHAWNILQQQLHRIEDEIAVKSNSVMLENRALETRRRLNTEITPSTETDRNRQLLNMDTSGLRHVLQSIY